MQFGLSELIQKEVEPRDVIDSAIDQINKKNPKLNAVVGFDL